MITKDKTISQRLEEKYFYAVNDMAKKYGISKSMYIRRLLDKEKEIQDHITLQIKAGK